MIFILIWCAVGAIIGGVCGWHSFEGIPGIFLGAFVGFALAFLLLLLLVGIMFAIYCRVPTMEVPEPVETIEIINLKDNYGIEGYFYYRHGSVNSELAYVYLYEVPNKGITIGEINAKDAYLNISNDETPRVEVYITRPKSDFWYNMFGANKTTYKVYLPNDAIVRDEYIIDLE